MHNAIRIFLTAGAFCLVLWLGAPPIQGAVRTAASVAESDVLKAYSACSDGDTILIPPGAATWTSQFFVSKAINIFGSGTNLSDGTATIITNGLGNTANALIVISLAADKPVRIATNVFVGGYTGSWKSAGVCVDVNSSVALHSVRLDHSIYYRFGWTAIFTENAAACGVIDHNQFINNDSDVYLTVRASDGDARWAAGPQLGTTNAMYIEANYCLRTSSYNYDPTPDEYQYHQQASQSVIRNNTIVSKSAVEQPALDIHGGFGSFRGTLGVEYYSNNVTISSTYRYCHPRGGVFFCFGNSFSDSSGIPEFCDLDFDSFDGITNSFIWNNTKNGAPQTSSMVVVAGGGYTLNNQYFLAAPNTSNGKPAGIYQNYRPLVYPHPLVTAQDNLVANTNPATQVSASSLVYQVPSGSSSNQTISIYNAGQGTLRGSVSLNTTSSPSPWSIIGPASYTNNGTITIRYAPTSSADSSATLTLTDNGGGGTVSLLGTIPQVYIECVGDSLTRGGASTTTNFVPGGYRLPLYQMLTNSGINVVFTGSTNDNSAPGLPYPQHDGYGGFEIGDIAADYPSYAAVIHPPDYVLLQCGLNDFRHNDAITQATNRLDSLISQIATTFPNAKILVADMNPWDNLGTTNAAMNAYYNPYIPDVVSGQVARGHQVYLADMREPYMTVSDVMPGDNTHLAASGYNKMASKWASVINSTISGDTNRPSPPSNLRVVQTQ